MRRLALALLLVLAAGPARAADREAHRLLAEGRAAEAAELFTDPAWKGVAFYRSGQMWRAAEAFARAGDPESLYNLANAYATLGQLSLAVETYLAVLTLLPGHADAAHNLDLVREALARAEEERPKAAGVRPREIDRVETKDDRRKDGAPEAGEGGAPPRPDTPRAETGEPTKPAEAGPGEGTGAGAGAARDREGRDDTGRAKGAASPDAAAAEKAGGSSTGTDGRAAGDPTPGERMRLEAAQATEQWLARIPDDPARFLAARLAVERQRRQAAGTARPAGGDPW